MARALIVLAAGKGTRMNSDLPKTLHQVGNRPLFAHALCAGGPETFERKVLVTGHGGAQLAAVARDFDETVEIVEQTEQLGTGHAVMVTRDALGDFDGDLLVLYGDAPFVTEETLNKVAAARATHDLVVLGFHAADPSRYGRMITDGDDLLRIVEFKDASAEERAVTFCNSGIMSASAKVMYALLDDVGNENASGEYYLTDVVAVAKGKGLKATSVACAEAETMGVNSRAELAAAEATFQTRMREAAIENGATLVDPASVYFSADTHLGRDVLVEPNVVFGPGVTVESGATIRAFSHLEGAHVGAGAIVGPYARLRPGTELSNDAKIGNFVEIKNATIGEGTKVNHLSYIGDAALGDGTNVGAGTVTCNYDGVNKHRTEIGRGVFVGSDTMFVAPVKIGDGAMTGSGSVVTDDVPAGALAVGRARQRNIPGFATKLFEKLKAAKEKRQKGS